MKLFVQGFMFHPFIFALLLPAGKPVSKETAINFGGPEDTSYCVYKHTKTTT